MRAGSAPGTSAPVVDVADRRWSGAARAARTHPTLRELTDAVPGLRDELVDRARGVGLLAGWVAVLLVPAWTLVDRVIVPGRAQEFLLIRLLCDVPILLLMLALWRWPVGRRMPERLTFLILAVVQIEIAWMIPRVPDPQYYLLGFTLALYASGCVLVARPRWTVNLVVTSWAALTASFALAATMPPQEELVATAIFVSTSSIIALLAHQRRYALSNRELANRISLEREQERSRALLARLERLSQEDPLTGLANRRAWDAELARACAEARERDGAVTVVLLDLDRFKEVNDRHGHPGGDEVLRQVARLLTARVRSEDLVARLGGDELAVLLPGVDGNRGAELAEELRREALLLRPPGFGPGEVSLSLGVATASGAAAFPLELMCGADQQLYRAKITRNAVAAPAG